jgi:enterochelin esterase-like enzyme
MPKRTGPADETTHRIRVEHLRIASEHLGREVLFELYPPPVMDHPGAVSLLLINDGQDLPAMRFRDILAGLYDEGVIRPVLCVGIHAGHARKQEYGTAGTPDYKQRGSKADLYTRFVFEELLPFVRSHTGAHHFHDKSFCGFSLGGLMALDIVWKHPHEFRHVGVFSGSLWWRTRALDDGYEEDRDRIMHARIREGAHHPWLRFFFQTGLLDEKEDRNNNGIIDSVDDTLDLIRELKRHGYRQDEDIRYLELEDGRHDVPTWGRAFPEFMEWAFGKGEK